MWLPATDVDLNEIQALEIAKEASATYGVNLDHLWNTIGCEDPTYDPNQQSNIIQKDGSREQSFGLAQINLPRNPDISLASATDPFFSINFMAKEFADNHAFLWTCWKEHHGVK